MRFFGSYFYDAKKNKDRSRLATALYIGLFVLLMAGILGGIFTLLAVKLCGPLAAAGLGWLYFALMGLIAVLLGAFGSIFNTYAGCTCPRITTCCCPCRFRCPAWWRPGCPGCI